MQSSPQPSIQPKISIQELNNIFCLASKNQNLPEVNNIDKIELFESNEELNEEFRNRLKKFIQSEHFYWTSEIIKNEQNMEEHGKNLVLIQELFKNTSKIAKPFKDLANVLKHVFRVKEIIMRLICKLNEDVHTLNYENIVKTLFSKLELTQKIAFPSGNDLEYLRIYHDLAQMELRVLKGLFMTLDAMQTMEFSKSLITLTKYKTILCEFAALRHKYIETKDESAMLMWYGNFHVHLVAKIRLYYREILDFTPIKNDDAMVDSNLLVRILESFEDTFPDTYIFLIAKDLSFKNPFTEIEISPEHNYKYLKVYKDFIVLCGKSEESTKEYLQNIAGLVDESFELLNSYLNKSMQRLVGKDVHYYFISRVDTSIYLGLFAKNYRGKRLEKVLTKLVLIVDILRNNYVKDVFTYHHMIHEGN